MVGGDVDNRFRKTRLQCFPRYKKEETDDGIYWKHLAFPISVQQHGPVECIDIAEQSPHFVAVTGSSRVQIYDTATTEVLKSFHKFKDGLSAAKFRGGGRGQDSNLGGLLLGVATGNDVQVFHVQSKSQLRSLKGHSQPVHDLDFLEDHKHLASFSDDKVVKLWDIPTQESISSFVEHTDYVRCGKASRVSTHVLASGSYDHTIKLWDTRTSNSNFTMNHGSPVEDILFFPNGSLLASAGGHKVCIWDLLSGGKLLATLTPHSKIITSLSLASNNTRLVSASLDRHVKFSDVRDYQVVHSISFPSPLLSTKVAPDDSMIAVGSTDGLVQFLHRQVPKSTQEIRQEKYVQNNKFLRFTNFVSGSGDVVVEQDHHRSKEPRYDHFLRKFEYSKALDQVIKPYVQKKFPNCTFSVLMELKRRDGLRQAIAGRDEKALLPILQFVSKNINEHKFSFLIIHVADVLLDIYGSTLGGTQATRNMFLNLRKRIHREVRNMRTLMELHGALDLILSASKSSKKPHYRVEEVNYRKRNVSFQANATPTTFEKLMLQSSC